MIVDLRSDTVTRPGAAMRARMAGADVGDDVYGEDPTVAALEAQVAALLGTEAALFVPSGTMANQIALKIHTQPGDDVLVGEGAHTWAFEAGGAGAIAGVQVTLLAGGGLFDAAAVAAAVKPPDDHYPPTRLVSIENTHNVSGGRVWPRATVDAVLAIAKTHGLAAHLDGARLWNAAVALGVPEADVARGFDTISVCLSKGLGAPVGSVLACSKALWPRAHRVRKMLGGGMRQAGVLAAAGLYALEHHRARLPADHARARTLGERLAQAPGLALAAPVETNIVLLDVTAPNLDATAVLALAKAEGVLAGKFASRRIRLVTHLDVDDAACDRAAVVLARITKS